MMNEKKHGEARQGKENIYVHLCLFAVKL